MSIGEPICTFYGFIKADRQRIFAEVAQREGPNTELFDLADELVVRGPSGEVERFVDALRKAIMMRMGEINAMHERDLMRHRKCKAEWEKRWLVKIVFDEQRDMESVEVFVRDLARKNALEHDCASEQAFIEEEMGNKIEEMGNLAGPDSLLRLEMDEMTWHTANLFDSELSRVIRGLREERLESKRQWNTWKRTQQEGAGEAGESDEPESEEQTGQPYARHGNAPLPPGPPPPLPLGPPPPWAKRGDAGGSEGGGTTWGGPAAAHAEPAPAPPPGPPPGAAGPAADQLPPGAVRVLTRPSATPASPSEFSSAKLSEHLRDLQLNTEGPKKLWTPGGEGAGRGGKGGSGAGKKGKVEPGQKHKPAGADATDATNGSTKCAPPAETCSVRGFGDDVSFWFGDDISGWGSTASARPSRIPPPGFPFPGCADVKTSNRARALNRVDERARQPNQAMRPLSVRVMSLSSKKTEREDARTARSPEGDERAVGYEPVADGADGDVAVAEDRRDHAPAAEATRREDVCDAAEASRDGDAKEADGEAERKAQLDQLDQLFAELEREVKRGRVRVPATEKGLPLAPSAVGESADASAPRPRPPIRRATRPPPRDRTRRVDFLPKAGGESRGGLYGFAKKAHAFLVERAARASAALAALFLSRAFLSPAGKMVDREVLRKKKPDLPRDFVPSNAKATEVMRRQTS